jgi:serine/threonine-protein kinase RsbW
MSKKKSPTSAIIKKSSRPLTPRGPKEVLVLPAKFDSLDLVRDFVAKSAEECGLEPAAVYAVQMAIDEAFTNIIEHAYGGECNEKIECTCQVYEQALSVALRDCGKPFDPAIIPEPDLDACLEEREVGGLGLFFMHRLMDEVRFDFAIESDTGKKCNVLTMVKHKEK